jgi:hypothetical protein
LDQTIINAVFSGFGAVLIFLFTTVWQGLRDCQKSDITLGAEIAAVRLMMADSYIKKADFDKLTSEIFSTLRRIEDKLDHKADKS